MSKIYLSNKALYIELVVSKNMGKLTPQAGKMIHLIAKNMINKMTYYNYMDKEDCLQSGILRALRFWRNFDEDRYENAFAFISEILKRAFAAEFNRLNQKNRLTGEYMRPMSLSQIFQEEVNI
jgi:hypothetical protein